jgi:hypothetical protein
LPKNSRQHLKSLRVARFSPLFDNVIERNEPRHLFEVRRTDERRVPSINEILTSPKILSYVCASHVSARARRGACPGTPGVNF